VNDSAIKCLVVDDEISVRQALVRVVKSCGYQVVEAGSGPEALAALEHDDVDLLISDLQMPGMDGVRLLGLVQERWPNVATIIVTGVAEIDTAVHLLQAGAYDYITKPFGVGEVRARMQQALQKRKLLVENRQYHDHLSDLVRVQAARIEELFLEAVQTVVHALEAKDAYTQGHSARVSAYSGRTAVELGISKVDIQLIELSAEVHDVGKIGVRESVLFKPGRLTDDEYRHIMEHAVIGARILAPLFKNAPQALAIVRSHHERLDGSGFPDGLRGDAVPFFARLVGVADAFDAMTSGRTYRPAMPVDRALQELSDHAGTQFDPDVVAAFLRAYGSGTRLPIATPRIERRSLPEGIAGVGFEDRLASAS
jgi:response regulator RpfG family c-di-GMP phosphodiesterase